MPIAVACPSCGAKLRAPANKAGHRTKCPKCGAAVVVPSPSRQAPEPARAESPPQPVQRVEPPYAAVYKPPPAHAVPVVVAHPKDAQRIAQDAEASEGPSDETYVGKDRFRLGRLPPSIVQGARKRCLDEGERLLAIVKGRAKAHATRPDGFFKVFEHETDKGGGFVLHYLIVTDRRVILWARGVFKSSTESFDYSDITGVEQQRGMVWGGVVLSVHGNKANFTEMHMEEAVLVADIIRQQKERALVAPLEAASRAAFVHASGASSAISSSATAGASGKAFKQQSPLGICLGCLFLLGLAASPLLCCGLIGSRLTSVPPTERIAAPAPGQQLQGVAAKAPTKPDHPPEPSGAPPRKAAKADPGAAAGESKKLIPYTFLRKVKRIDGLYVMKVLVEEEATRQEVLDLAESLRQEYAGKYAEIGIFDSREAWEHEGELPNQKYLEKEFWRHCLVEMIADPEIRTAAGFGGEINWVAEGRGH